MEVFPSEYQNLELSRYDKLFVRFAVSSESEGFLLLKVNPSMQSNDSMNVVILPKGVVFFKFFDEFETSSDVIGAMGIYTSILYPTASNIISTKLHTNKALCDTKGTLRFPASVVYVFPNVKKAEVERQAISAQVKKFVAQNCWFAEEFSNLRTNFVGMLEECLKHPIAPVSENRLTIDDKSVNSVLQRIAPEYVTIRVAPISDRGGSRGADEELLVVDENDKAVRAFRLDREQINIVNKISKGDQLILACAGSGKSVLLISKCFKAARMNPEKKFLITCYNNNLYSLYLWYIDRAGLKEKNVVCLTFDQLCISLLGANSKRYTDYDSLRVAAIAALNSGKITQRYYGIFIDEVQIFQPEWYKFCYNLLENKDSEDHIFVICGDKTQDLEKKKRHGTAPWQAGEGYPTYRGGNKNIRIERNYRNCIEINEFINRFVSKSKDYLYSIEPSLAIDPEMFLRGQSVTNGIGVKYKQLVDFSNNGEAEMVMKSIKEIHDVHEIPYDEIAVIMFNGTYRGAIPHWRERQYLLENFLIQKMSQSDIPYTRLYHVEGEKREHFGELGGVKMLKFHSTLGLDFRAAIICGMKPLGLHDAIKTPNWSALKDEEELFSNKVQATHACIRNLYVACTRAKEVLHIIAPETPSESIFVKLLKESI